jgi:hypothetical protein
MLFRFETSRVVMVDCKSCSLDVDVDDDDLSSWSSVARTACAFSTIH